MYIRPFYIYCSLNFSLLCRRCRFSYIQQRGVHSSFFPVCSRKTSSLLWYRCVAAIYIMQAHPITASLSHSFLSRSRHSRSLSLPQYVQYNIVTTRENYNLIFFARFLVCHSLSFTTTTDDPLSTAIGEQKQ